MSEWTSEDRDLLRAVDAYGLSGATQQDVARALGVTRQRVTAMTRTLEDGGLLEARRPQGLSGVYYFLTDAGRAELEASKTVLLLVEVDDRQAGDVAAYLRQSVNGITDVTGHAQGCCCQHCPHKGNCR